MLSFSGQTISEFVDDLAKSGLFPGLGPTHLLRSLPLFRQLQDADLGQLATSATLHTFEAGAAICRQGEFIDDIFIVLAGGVDTALVTDRTQRISLAEHGPGALFGRLSPASDGMNLFTVFAVTRTNLLAIRSEVLFGLAQKYPAITQALQTAHLKGAVGAALRLVPLFSDAEPEAFEQIARAGRLRVYPKGTVVFEKGDPGDSLYLVVSGIVKVYIQDRILAYLKSGAYFGEMALVKNEPRMASVAALTDVEAFQIMKADFQAFLDTHGPAVEALRRTIQQREEENLELERHPERAERLRFLESLMGGQDILVIDLTRCVRCDKCVQVCAQVRGQARFERKGDYYGGYLIATACRQCRDPACMLCKRDAIVRDKTGEIYIKDTCIGCGFCAKQCPYGNIIIVEVELPSMGGQRQTRKKAVKCDLCRHLPYPPCVLNCPTGALARVDPEELFLHRKV